MPNHHRGEIEGILDGTPYALCLTLGALAELEAAFGDENMLALAQRFEGGRLSARDCVRIIGAGLRGGGHKIADEAVARMQAEGGVAGFVDIVARLLTITFGGKVAAVQPDSASSPIAPLPRCEDGQAVANAPQPASREVPAPVPFPGRT
jgi:hypothetical protein